MDFTSNLMDVIVQKWTFKYSDFETEADTSVTFNIPYRGTTIYLLGITGKVNTAFATGTAPQVKVGIEGLDDYLMPLQRLDKVGHLMSGKKGQLFCSSLSGLPITENTIRLTVQNTTGNLSAYTAGEFEIVLVYVTDKPTRY